MLKSLSTVLVLAILALGSIRPAHAQFAVIDVASIVQLVQQVQQLEQQVATAKSQLSQAQAEFAAITGSRGMQQLLSGTNRNYLPSNWTQISQILSGSSGSYPALASQLKGQISSNAVLTPSQVNSLSTNQLAQLTAARQAPALLQTLSRTAVTNSSNRFSSLQQLISAIGSANDAKGALDLATRIQAEEAMLQNDESKLQGLYQVAQSQEMARRQQVREQAISDQGSLEQLPAMGL